MKTGRRVFLAVGALALAACTDGDSGGEPEISPGVGVCGVFSSELRIEDRFSQASPTFSPGEPITFDLQISNNSDAQATLGSDGCGPARYIVFASGDRAVFDTLPEGTACTQQYVAFDYAPRETRAFRLEWNQDTNDKTGQATAGDYTVNVRDRSAECHGDLDRVGNFRIQ